VFSEIAWQSALLNSDSTIHDAILNVNETSLKIVLVVNQRGILMGTICDGDIRRGVLRGLDLGENVTEIMNANPFVMPKGVSNAVMSEFMRTNEILHLPIVDELSCVIGLYLWDEKLSPAYRSNTVVVMAGGEGKRLRPHTNKLPKPMVLVGGKPMLEHIIDQAKSEGFRQFVLSVHYMGSVIEEYFGNGEKFGVEISYLRETKALGTAGALSLFEDPPRDPLVITNGDVLTNIRYSELLDFHVEHNADATMAIKRHDWEIPFGVIEVDGEAIVSIEEKPTITNYVNSGIYILESSVISLLDRDQKCDMPLLLDRLLQTNKRLVGYPMHEAWLDIGRPEDLLKACRLRQP